MDPTLLNLFTARLAAGASRESALESAAEDLAYLAKLSQQAQQATSHATTPAPATPMPSSAENSSQLAPATPTAQSSYIDSYISIVESVLSKYGHEGQKILIEINRQASKSKS